MNSKGGKEYRAMRRWLLHLSSIAVASAFIRQPSLVTKTRPIHPILTTSIRYHRTAVRSAVDKTSEFDALLEKPSTFAKAIRFLKSNPDEIDLSSPDRFVRVFDAIEMRTSDSEDLADQQQQSQQIVSEARNEMSAMYSALKDQGHLRLFGAIDKENMPANGSHTVKPSMLETITSLSMSSLTPQPSNTLTYAGAIAAFAEVAASATFGWDLNALFLSTIVAALFDQVIFNGALSETVLKILSPETQPKITRHEAGHFLCSYILGCPVEGYVLSSWGALQDPRFRGMGVSAGTSFFDPTLSKQIESTKITRSSIDRYSIIVMSGIAAEAIMYGKADGGAGDEQALIGFLSNLNGGSTSSAPVWNDLTIRNQARWGALQSVLILREYKECYDALVETLERNGSLGECIYAIENAARVHNKKPLRIPLGYIKEEGAEEVWTKNVPNESGGDGSAIPELVIEKEIFNREESLETLRSYKEELTKKIKDIDGKLEGL
eukprot:CAMPEP_0116127848 /NCGR_PEP_ID=MMETSP0329-20121206/7050_1 /TAXON_ID=697910 /ORGANISM="Pseudo-nitzschia arenysensis, Strain B593" /LENGTH=492 /DNA_ID=CAMNT_0003621957 /DNA_START=48 /DNA_END=1526 /DNA_ORIENTATION=+